MHDCYINPEKYMLENNPTIEPYFYDISAETASAAFNGTSHSPDTRGARFRCDYSLTLIESLRDVRATVERARNAGADIPADCRARLATWFAEFRQQLKAAHLAYLSAHGRCISWAVTGPSNFPGARAHKANQTADNRLRDIRDCITNGKKRILRELLPHGDGSEIRTNDPKAADKITGKIDSLEKERDRMKAVNKIIRRHLGGLKIEGADPARIAATRAALSNDLEYSTAAIDEMMKPNYMGRIGYESWQLSNLGAEIRRLRGRTAEVERAQSTEINDTFADGVTACINERGQIKIEFPGIPDESVRAKLKSNAFKWSRAQVAWVRKVTDNALAAYERTVKPALAEHYQGQ